LPDYDESFRTAFDFLSNPYKLWTNGKLEDERVVLKLALDSYLQCDWTEGVQTPQISLPLKVLGPHCDREKF